MAVNPTLMKALADYRAKYLGNDPVSIDLDVFSQPIFFLEKENILQLCKQYLGNQYDKYIRTYGEIKTIILVLRNSKSNDLDQPDLQQTKVAGLQIDSDLAKESDAAREKIEAPEPDFSFHILTGLDFEPDFEQGTDAGPQMDWSSVKELGAPRDKEEPKPLTLAEAVERLKNERQEPEWKRQLMERLEIDQQTTGWYRLGEETGESARQEKERQEREQLEKEWELQEMLRNYQQRELERQEKQREEEIRQRHAAELGWVQYCRQPSAIAGLKIGILSGGILLAFIWLIHLIWKVPYWYTLSSLLNGILPVTVVAVALDLFTDKLSRQFNFRSILYFYIVSAFLGAIIGAVRWGTGSQWSITDWVDDIFAFGDNVYSFFFAITLILTFLLWLYSRLNKRKDEIELPGSLAILTSISDYLGYFLVGLLYIAGVVIDAYHFPPWIFGKTQGISAVVNQHAWLFALIFSSLTGALIGYILPDRRIRVY